MVLILNRIPSVVMMNVFMATLLGVLAFRNTLAQEQWDTEPGKTFTYKCKDHEALRELDTKYMDDEMDRDFYFKCGSHQAFASDKGRWETDWINDYKQFIVFQCPGDSVMFGLYSKFSDKHHDRIFKARCRIPYGYLVLNCTDSMRINDFHARGLFNTGSSTRFIKGFISQYDDEKKDREFWIVYCELYGKHN